PVRQVFSNLSYYVTKSSRTEPFQLRCCPRPRLETCPMSYVTKPTRAVPIPAALLSWSRRTGWKPVRNLSYGTLKGLTTGPSGGTAGAGAARPGKIDCTSGLQCKRTRAGMDLGRNRGEIACGAPDRGSQCNPCGAAGCAGGGRRWTRG